MNNEVCLTLNGGKIIHPGYFSNGMFYASCGCPRPILKREWKKVCDGHGEVTCKKGQSARRFWEMKQKWGA